jgi:hypothetical protein
VYDFVRVEIAAALKRDILVIPILLDGTRVPDDLKPLASRNGLNIRHDSFPSDVDKLARSLKKQIKDRERRRLGPGVA